MRIREYEERDLPAIRACVMALQDYERALDARMPPGAEMVDAYMTRMLERCRTSKGTIFVGERSGAVVGFVCIWSRVTSDEPNEGPKEYGLVSDLVVLPAFRGRGAGRALLARAEAYAREHDVRWLRVGVLSKNEPALALYARAGYEPYLTYLEKQLGGGAATSG